MIFARAGAREGLGRARPVDPGRDMGAIADLIEAAFRGELDRIGSNLVAEMRHLAAFGPLLTIADRVTSFPSGYVWEQNGRVVGNVTITLDDLAARRWFVSNVAVHPDWQGQGIGGRLMEVALDSVRRQGGRQILLQVRAENKQAHRLYCRLGFECFDTLVELLRPGALPAQPAPQLGLRRLRGQDWASLLELARAATPPRAQEVRPLTERAYHPTAGRRLRKWLDAFLYGRQTVRWGLEQAGALVAAVSASTYGHGASAQLDLTVRPAARGPLEGPLADAGLATLVAWGPRAVTATISTGHPEALQALRTRHFTAVRTLDQLALRLAH
jgi:ribosomal protein S18 acetylase RimI-like enzyme